jgi:Acetyltransferase (GNAT) domain
MITVLEYAPSEASVWNSTNREARNGHFLFDRGFMEYHADRFEDASLIIRLDGEAISLLPANRSGDTVYSHQGLTFGGLVLGNQASTVLVLQIFAELIKFFSAQGVSRLIYKPIPSIYHTRPAEEDRYALFRVGATLIAREVTTTICYDQEVIYSSRRKRGIRKANQSQLVFAKSDDWETYWGILSLTLSERHGVSAVHSVDEIRMLAERFPANIYLFTAVEQRSMVAGVVIFETENVAHAQYISSSARGRQIGALDGLFDYLIKYYHGKKRYFDFGISTESGGQSLNDGLMAHKEEFGGTAVVHDRYELRF